MNGKQKRGYTRLHGAYAAVNTEKGSAEYVRDVAERDHLIFEQLYKLRSKWDTDKSRALHREKLRRFSHREGASLFRGFGTNFSLLVGA